MPWQEHIGRIFNRRRDIQALLGGDRIKGISFGEDSNAVIAVSAPEGERYGYHDRFLDDGSFEYYGQRAQRGDAWRNSNNEVRDHVVNGRALLLFVKEPDRQYRFDGEWIYNGHREVEVETTDGPAPQVVFNLIRADSIDDEALEEQVTKFLADDGELIRRRAIEASNSRAGTTKESNYYYRAAAVAAHVRKRADGVCECCGTKAPFLNKQGQPYLECHHIDRRSDNGADDIYSVIALHPTCHRFVHHAADGEAKNEELRELMHKLEPRPAD